MIPDDRQAQPSVRRLVQPVQRAQTQLHPVEVGRRPSQPSSSSGSSSGSMRPLWRVDGLSLAGPRTIESALIPEAERKPSGVIEVSLMSVVTLRHDLIQGRGGEPASIVPADGRGRPARAGRVACSIPGLPGGATSVAANRQVRRGHVGVDHISTGAKRCSAEGRCRTSGGAVLAFLGGACSICSGHQGSRVGLTLSLPVRDQPGLGAKRPGDGKAAMNTTPSRETGRQAAETLAER